MATRDVLVAGGGPAGLSLALALARAGASVTVVERETLDTDLTPAEALSAERRGIAHYHAPHAFLPRGAKVMRERLPDVYATLLEHGAYELPIARNLPDERPEDAELILFCVRRPVIEWALRRAVSREAGIEVVPARIDGLLVDRGNVSGLATSEGDLHAPLTVDAMGRTSRAPRWLADAGVAVPEESHEVGIIYYYRYFRLLGNGDYPESPHPYGPRGDLGYALYATFMGDDRTFAVAFMVATGDSALKAVKEPAALQACFGAIPELAEWVDPARSTPITPVVAMGALRTVWRDWPVAAPPGFVAVADAFCHTDPTFALGLSLGLVHGFALADAELDASTFWQSVTPELRERFELARDASAVRFARLRGEDPPEFENAATFGMLNAYAALDPDIFRTAFRRTGFLDPLGPLDPALQARIAELPRPEPPPPAPTRDELVAAISSA